MSLESLKKPARSIDVPRDKPQVDRIEHANLQRPGAALHPSARRAAHGSAWGRYLASPAWR